MKDLQRINIKVFTPAPAKVELAPFLKILDAWKDENKEWLDVADYGHMVEGPGILIFGNVRFVSFDVTDGQPGVLYSHRSGLQGSLSERFQSVLTQALAITRKIVNDPLCPASVQKETRQLEVLVNDRAQAPLSPETESLLGAPLKEALQHIFGTHSFDLGPVEDSRGRFGYTVHLKSAISLKV